MTPEAAIHQFMSGFGIPAYAATSTPSDAVMPYLTYDIVLGEWNAGETNMTVNLWYLTDSEALPNAKVRELYRAIGAGGVQVQCDNGTLWFKRGNPWAQPMRVEGENEKVKRRYINVNVEYNLTE